MATKVLDWPKHLLDELARNQNNGRVGGRLVSETERVRVWYIALKPGERLGFHKHVLNYFWTALTDGISLQHTDDGTTRRVVYRAGETRHFSFPGDEYILHDLYNDGPSELAFLTVEHKS